MTHPARAAGPWSLDDCISTRLVDARRAGALARAAGLRPQPPRRADATVRLLSQGLWALVEREFGRADGGLRCWQAGARTFIEVLGSVVYVVDRGERLVRAQLVGTETGPSAGAETNIDLLYPLTAPVWLRALAFRRHWSGAVLYRGGGREYPWGPAAGETAQAAQALACAHAALQRDSRFVLLRHRLAGHLMQAIGRGTVELALRASPARSGCGLNSQLLNAVWPVEAGLLAVSQDDPRLLRLYALWAAEHGNIDIDPGPAAIATLRRQMLGDDLPPRAWRVLAGPQGMARHVGQAPWRTWSGVRDLLLSLQLAGWPRLPPVPLLRALHSVARRPAPPPRGPGGPDTAERVPAWFWSLLCQAGGASGHSPARMTQLHTELLRWTELVLRHRPEPDGPQRKSGAAWLARWADEVEDYPRAGWHRWLQGAVWPLSGPLRAVLLADDRSVYRAATALGNCAGAWVARCAQERALLFVVNNRDGHGPVALIGLRREQHAWAVHEVKGPHNAAPPPAADDLADEVLSQVQARWYHRNRRPARSAAT